MTRYVSLLAVAFAALCLLSSGAFGANFSVTPTLLEIKKDSESTNLKVMNRSSVATPVQAKVYTWKIDAYGEETLEPSTDVVYFPKIVTLEPGETVTLRLAYKGKHPSAHEKPYRVIVSEIPYEDEEKGGVTFFMKISVPLFIAPREIIDLPPYIEDISLEGNVLKLPVSNNGSKHFKVAAIEVKGFDGEGNEVLSHSVNGWYVLGGNKRIFPVELPEGGREKADSYKASVVTGKFTLTGTYPPEKSDAPSPPSE